MYILYIRITTFFHYILWLFQDTVLIGTYEPTVQKQGFLMLHFEMCVLLFFPTGATERVTSDYTTVLPVSPVHDFERSLITKKKKARQN